MNTLFNGPCFIINMDRCPDRLALTKERVAAAGYKDIRRWAGVDAGVDNLSDAWAAHGSPLFWPGDAEFVTYPGKQGCMLSWLGLLKHIIESELPLVTVFEDDVLFHKDWAKLAPLYYNAMPKDYDYFYMGGQLDGPSESSIDRVPMFCTHALVFTLAGAKKIYELLTKSPRGISTIDCMLLDMHKLGGLCPFTYYIWNGTMYPDPVAIMAKDWTKRNAGLVFQDYDAGTFVREW